MTITCIVPNYNHARYLPERLASIQAQTRQPDDILLMDDCSSDGSREVLAAWAKDRPHARLDFNRANSGSGYAQWNRGVHEARGDFIWIAESDDACRPQLLESLETALRLNPTVAYAACESIETDEHLAPQRKAQDFIRGGAIDWSQSQFVSPREALRYFLRHNIVVNAGAVLFRKKSFLAVGGADRRHRLNADWLLWATLAGEEGFAWHAEALNLFRFHGASVRSTTRQAHAMREVADVVETIADHPLVDPKEASAAQKRIEHLWSGILVHNLSPLGVMRVLAGAGRYRRGLTREVWNHYSLAIARRLRPSLH